MIDVPTDSKNVPTFYTSKQKSAEKAKPAARLCVRLQRVHEQVTNVLALNGPAEWGPSDHCRVMITVS